MPAPEPPPRSNLRPPSAVISPSALRSSSLAPKAKASPTTSQRLTTMPSSSTSSNAMSTTTKSSPTPSSLSRATAASAQKQSLPSPTRVRTSSSKPDLVVPRSRTSSTASSPSQSTSSAGAPSRVPTRSTGPTSSSVGRASGRMLSSTLASPSSASGSAGKTAGRSLSGSTVTRKSSSASTQPPTPRTPATPKSPATPATPLTPSSPSRDRRAPSVYAPSSAALRRAADPSPALANGTRSGSSSRSVSPAPAVYVEAFASARAAIARGRERIGVRSPVSPTSPGSVVSPPPASATSSDSATTASPNSGGGRIGPVSPAVSAVGLQLHAHTEVEEVGLGPSLERSESVPMQTSSEGASSTAMPLNKSRTRSSSRNRAEPSSSPVGPSGALAGSNLSPPMEPRLRTTSSNSSLQASGSHPRSPSTKSSSSRTKSDNQDGEKQNERGRSADAEREHERSRAGAASRSRERDRVPFPREDAPALPSNSTAVPSASASSGSRDGTVGRPSSIGVGRSISASTPSNSHIPLAMRNRHRENSDPHAKLLATAAARAPGSPPQHTIALAQQHNSQQQQRQRTPERGGLERQGSLRTPELALDMKRLLAKPVSVSAARLPSDSEDVFAAEGRRPSLDGVPIRRKHYDSSGRREEGAVVAARRSEDSAKDRARQKAEREVALALVGPHGAAQEKEKEKRPKNVLRRRPSAQRPQTAPTEPPTLSSPAVLMPPAARTAPPVLSLNLSLNPMQLPSFDSSGASPKGSPPEDGNDGNGQLTPAGAVVEAYKRGLETSPSGSPLPSPASPSHMFNRTPASDNGHDPPKVVTPPVTPYYTVFGSTSGRVVAVGGPEDSWDGAGSYISATAFPMLDGIRRTAKNSVGRTLTRKVSERWTKKREDSEEEVRGRTSSQTDPRKKSTRSASRAGAEETPVEAEFPKSPVTMTQEDVGGFTNEPRSRRSEPAMGGGSRIWKLMKRISTGGLKEKYERGTPRTLPPLPPMPPVAIPPVPQLPKEHALEVRTAMSSDGHSQEPGVLTRFMQSRTSISTSRPTAPGSTIPRPSARALPMPPPIPASQSQPRTSTATRSSSPVSSDVASSKYFHKTTGSARSSTSSYGEETAPPLPKVIIGKHIIPPKELYKLELEGDFKPSSLDDKVKPMTTVFRSTEDWRIIATPAEEHPPPLSLPHPPRRLPTPNANAKERRVSDAPSIPEFSTAAPINAFTPRKTQPVMDRPRVESLLSSLGPAPAAPRRSISSVNEASGVQDDTFGRQNWRTSSAPSTSSRPQRSQQRATSVPRVPQEPLTFRELTKQSMQLSEKEKADKWEDLLERSNRAGGTIHLGTSDKLASDDVSLRYSASSAQLLKDF